MKSKSIIVIILIIVINIIFFNINKVQASSISDVIKGGDNFISAGKDDKAKIDESKLKNTSTAIYNILLIIEMCTAVIIAGILGIKFMVGSVEEKAQIKDALVPFIIGCIVVFGAFGIWKISINMFSGIDSSEVKVQEDKDLK